MANEAVIIELGSNGGNPVRRTCADGATIEKGTLLVLSDPNTVAANSGTGEVFGGIAAHEKVANDGSTSISCYTSGVFDLTCNAGVGITCGDVVVTSGANLIRVGTSAELSGANLGKVIGYAEETATASEVIRVRLKGF